MIDLLFVLTKLQHRISKTFHHCSRILFTVSDETHHCANSKQDLTDLLEIFGSQQNFDSCDKNVELDCSSLLGKTQVKCDRIKLMLPIFGPENILCNCVVFASNCICFHLVSVLSHQNSYSIFRFWLLKV